MNKEQLKFCGPQRHAPLSKVTAEDYNAFIGSRITLSSIAARIDCDPSAISQLFKRWREEGIPSDRLCDGVPYVTTMNQESIQ